MADHHSSHNDYVHGEMDIHQHEHSFGLFVSMTKWGSLLLAVLGSFLVILTCTKLGFITAGAVGVVVAAVGWFLLKSKPDSGH